VSRFLLVELEQDLAAERTTWNAAFLSLRQVVGVCSVADLEALSVRTLVDMMARNGERNALHNGERNGGLGTVRRDVS
jgi:hypothetical protein